MKRLLVLGFLVTGGLSLAWSQTPPPSVSGSDPDPVNFTGKVTGYTTTDIRTNRYTFAAGARSHWHTHERGQAIIVEQGRMRTQEFGHPLRHYDPNQTFFTAPGVKHWHGASPDGPMRQVSVSFGVTTWLEPVTDSQYSTTR
jgi:quercetin dioxygenase-like cupin family protein